MSEQQTGEVFEEAESIATDDFADESADEPRRSRWFWPLLIAMAMTLLLIARWLILRNSPVQVETLADVLAKLNDVQTLHLQLQQGSKTNEVWVQTRARLRRDLEPNEYQVDDGQALWTVRRDEYRVTRDPSAYFTPPTSELNVLSLIGVTHPQVQINLLARRSTEKTAQADAISYRFQAPAGVGHPAMEIEAVARSSDRMLQSLRLKTVQPSGITRTYHLRVVAVDEPVDDELFAIPEEWIEGSRE